MDYDKILSSTYDWIHLNKISWFLTFFWLGFIVLMLVPIGLQSNFFYEKFSWFIYSLYFIMYVVVLFGLMLLVSELLKHKKFSHASISFLTFFDTFFLVFLELWHVFVWNIYRSFRFTQLLLLAGIPLLYYFNSISQNILSYFALWIFIIGYFLLVVYNSIRLSFTVSLFYKEPIISLNDAINISWRLTAGKLKSIAFGYFLILGSVFVLFSFIVVVVTLIVATILSYFLIIPVAFDVAKGIAILFALAPILLSYHSGFLELFSQLSSEESSERILKKLLAEDILSPKNKKLMKKKPKRKKEIKKKKSKKISKKRKTTKKNPKNSF
jgi:hypothetical protein